MRRPTARRTALLALAVAGCLLPALAPTPAAAATDCAHDWVPNPPSNDDRADLKDFGGPTWSVNGITCWSTAEAGEPAHAGQAAAKSVWLELDTYEPYTVRIDVYTAGSDFDTRLAVYSQTGALVAQNDDATSSNRTSKVSFLRTDVSNAYQMAIDGYTSGGATADGTYIVTYRLPLVAFTSTTHLTRATMKIYADRAPTSSEVTKTVQEYQDGHYFQPGFIMVHLASAAVGEAKPIARLYTAVFDRLPDPSGLAYWVKKHRTGTKLATIAASMTASKEFVNTYGKLDNAHFVDLVYSNVLDRSPDAGGRSYWITKLNGGFKRSAMMAQFSESNEFKTKSGRLMEAAVQWRLGHGSKTDAQLKAMVASSAQFNGVDSFGLLLEDAGFKSFVAGL